MVLERFVIQITGNRDQGLKLAIDFPLNVIVHRLSRRLFARTINSVAVKYSEKQKIKRYPHGINEANP